MNRYAPMSAVRMPPERYMPPAPPEDESEMPLALAYVVWQNWGTVFEPQTALVKGTIFTALDMPFTPCGGARK